MIQLIFFQFIILAKNFICYDWLQKRIYFNWKNRRYPRNQIFPKTASKKRIISPSTRPSQNTCEFHTVLSFFANPKSHQRTINFIINRTCIVLRKSTRAILTASLKRKKNSICIFLKIFIPIQTPIFILRVHWLCCYHSPLTCRNITESQVS